LLRWATVPEQSGPKSGGLLCPFPWGRGGSWAPSNTMSPGMRPTSVPSGILIHPAVCPQYTNVTDRQDRQVRQRPDSIGQAVLQMGRPKIGHTNKYKGNIIQNKDKKLRLVALHNVHSANRMSQFLQYCSLSEAQLDSLS